MHTNFFENCLPCSYYCKLLAIFINPPYNKNNIPPNFKAHYLYVYA